MAITEAVDENGNVVLDFESFLQTVPAEFYIEGQDPSNIHNVCKENAIAILSQIINKIFIFFNISASYIYATSCRSIDSPLSL